MYTHSLAPYESKLDVIHDSKYSGLKNTQVGGGDEERVYVHQPSYRDRGLDLCIVTKTGEK